MLCFTLLGRQVLLTLHDTAVSLLLPALCLAYLQAVWLELSPQVVMLWSWNFRTTARPTVWWCSGPVPSSADRGVRHRTSRSSSKPITPGQECRQSNMKPVEPLPAASAIQDDNREPSKRPVSCPTGKIVCRLFGTRRKWAVLLCNRTNINRTLDCRFDHTWFFPALLWRCAFSTASAPI